MKKRPPTRVLCDRVKEIRSFFFERTAKADASPKQKEGAKKNTFSLIIVYVFFANQKEEAVFLRRPDLWNLFIHYSKNGHGYRITLFTYITH